MRCLPVQYIQIIVQILMVSIGKGIHTMSEIYTDDIKVSVIIPIYNMEKYLPECLDSVISQTLQEIEIIAVNDGSTDDSLFILKEYQKRRNNFHILNQENQGVGIAKNNGIKCAKGKYLIILDPDDYYPSNDCIEILYETAEREQVSICGGRRIQKNGDIYTENTIVGCYDISKYERNCLKKSIDFFDIYEHQRYLFLRELIISNNIFFPAYQRFEDPPFTVKAIGCAQVFYEIDKPVYIYRVGYKKIEYTLKMCTDILCGIRDVFQLVIKYDLKNMYINRLYNIMEENLIPVYKYAFKGIREIDNIIMEINEFRKEQKFMNDDKIITKAKVKVCIEEYMKEYSDVCKILTSQKKVLLYGTGVYTSSFIEMFSGNLNNVVGVAVSKLDSEEAKKYMGFEVKQIDQYKKMKDHVYILITTMSCYHNEIKEHLKQIGFKYIICVHKQGLELIKSMNRE